MIIYYKVLGLKEGSSEAEIKKAYRNIAKECHPDRTNDLKKIKRFDLATKAYDNLIDQLDSRKDDKTKFDPIGNWTVEELESKLAEFFQREGLEATVGIYSRRQAFQMDGVRYWMQKGLLELANIFDEDDLLGDGMGQSMEYTYRLTLKGRKYIQESKNRVTLNSSKPLRT